eukprot:6933739-Karenia_brevis.AAC.1
MVRRSPTLPPAASHSNVESLFSLEGLPGYQVMVTLSSHTCGPLLSCQLPRTVWRSSVGLMSNSINSFVKSAQLGDACFE